MASETPRQVYERVTGKPWPKPGSPEAQEMLDSLGIKAKSGSAAANLALAKALTAPAPEPSTPAPSPRGNAIEAGYRRMVGDEAPAALNKGFLGLLGMGRPKAFSKEFVGPQQDELVGPQQAELGLLGHLQKALAATRQGIGSAAESGGKYIGVPLHTRLAVGSLIGNRAPITNADLTPEELAAVQSRFKGGTISNYDQYPEEFKLHTSNPLARMFDRSQAINQSFGRAGVDSPRPGQQRMFDIYDYVNPAREDELLRYDKTGNSMEKVAEAIKILSEQAADKGGMYAMNEIPDQVMNMAMGREGRPVDIRFPADIDLSGPSRKPAKRGPTTLQRAIRKTNN